MKPKIGFVLNEILIPGDKIRAYDFPFEIDFYVEGVISVINESFIEIDCDCDTKPGGHYKGTKVLIPLFTLLDEIWEGDRIIKL